MNIQEYLVEIDLAHEHLRRALQKITPGMDPALNRFATNTQISNAFGLLRASVVTAEAARRELAK